MENNISSFRKDLKKTQQELADEVDVTRQTIIALEQGRYNPSLLLAFRVTKALEADLIEDVFYFSHDDLHEKKN